VRLDEPVAVLPRDDGAFQDGGVGGEHRLDFDRRDPDAADLEHVVASAGVPEEAVRIRAILVAGRIQSPASVRLVASCLFQ
jgi:hypothetical protein